METKNEEFIGNIFLVRVEKASSSLLESTVSEIDIFGNDTLEMGWSKKKNSHLEVILHIYCLENH